MYHGHFRTALINALRTIVRYTYQQHTVFNGILDSAQAVAHGILNLVERVAVGALHQNGHTLRVLHILNKGVPRSIDKYTDYIISFFLMSIPCNEPYGMNSSINIPIQCIHHTCPRQSLAHIQIQHVPAVTRSNHRRHSAQHPRKQGSIWNNIYEP
jgi:hypothetical protein